MSKETVRYLIFGVMTTVVYLLSRFLFIYLTNNSLLSVIIAQVISILFAFFTNKLFVFESNSLNIKDILTELFKFFTGRLFVMFIDLGMTFIFVTKYSYFFIGHLYSEIDYTNMIFSNPLSVNFIGNPKLLNEFIVTLFVQIIAIVSNYFISKYIVFKGDKNG